jgi:asparagine synthetase B (glutamine-hydrolysing)
MAPAYWSNRRHRKVVNSTPAWVAPDPELRKRIDERASRVLAPTQPRNDSFYERELRISLEHPLVALEAEEYFEMGRRAGLEIVHPYWDLDLVNLLYRTPPQLLSKNGQSKSLVRETVARRFPNIGFERQKKVRATEFYWKIMQTEGRTAWGAMRQASALADMGVVDATLLSKTLAELFDGRRERESYRIWNTLHLEAWARPRA